MKISVNARINSMYCKVHICGPKLTGAFAYVTAKTGYKKFMLTSIKDAEPKIYMNVLIPESVKEVIVLEDMPEGDVKVDGAIDVYRVKVERVSYIVIFVDPESFVDEVIIDNNDADEVNEDNDECIDMLFV
jgi:hypothetical protein